MWGWLRLRRAAWRAAAAPGQRQCAWGGRLAWPAAAGQAWRQVSARSACIRSGRRRGSRGGPWCQRQRLQGKGRVGRGEGGQCRARPGQTVLAGCRTRTACEDVQRRGCGLHSIGAVQVQYTCDTRAVLMRNGATFAHTRDTAFCADIQAAAGGREVNAADVRFAVQAAHIQHLRYRPCMEGSTGCSGTKASCSCWESWRRIP